MKKPSYNLTKTRFYSLVLSLLFVNYSFGQIKYQSGKLETKDAGIIRIVHETEDNIYFSIKDIAHNVFTGMNKTSMKTLGRHKIKIIREDYGFSKDYILSAKLNLIKKKCGANIVKYNFVNNSKQEKFFPCPEGFDFAWYSSTEIISSENGDFHLLQMYNNEKLGGENYNILVDQNLNEVKSFITSLDDGKTIEKFVDNDGSIYFLKSNFKLVCYNALKDYEVWEQNIEFEGELTGNGTFYGLDTKVKDNKIEFHSKFFTDEKEFWITMPINYYTKEIENLKIKEVNYISPKKKGYVDDEAGYSTFFSRSKKEKYRFVGGDKLEFVYTLTFHDAERDSVKTRKYQQNSKVDENWFNGIGYEIDSSRLILLFNIHKSEIEKGKTLQGIASSDSVVFNKFILSRSPLHTIYQVINRETGIVDKTDILFNYEGLRRSRIRVDPTTIIKSKYNDEYYILGYRLGASFKGGVLPMNFKLLKFKI